MVPQSRPRKTGNSSKVNLLISFIFHAFIVLVAFYFAARGGLLGKQLKKIAVEMVKEKKPEKPKLAEKPKSELPKVQTPREPPKVQAPKLAEAPRVSAPPPPAAPAAAPPAVAPPAAELPQFQFGGGRQVESSSDPVTVYQGLLQSVFTAQWNKPEDIDDGNFVAEVQVSIGPDGRVSDAQWLKGSGNARWDNSVRQAIASVTKVDRPPPPSFPPRVVIRFDVQEETEAALQ